MSICTKYDHRTTRRRMMMCCVAMCCGIGSPGIILAQNAQSSAKTAEDRSKPAAEKTAKTDEAAEAKRRKQKVQAGFYLLSGIAFIGVLTILGVVLWGVRVRRRARERPKPCPPPDPLWYLRKGAKEKPQPEGPIESETGSSHDDATGA